MKRLIEPIAILGFGSEGQSALSFCQNQGLKNLTICDEKENVEVPKGMKSKLGKSAFVGLENFKTIIRSPGVHYNLPGLQEAKEAGAMVTSMTEMTLEVGRERLTAITGSNGKTTTTGMLDAILTAHYDGKIIVGGNDRKVVLEDALKHPEWPILMEVSSFQFADLKMSPHISGVLNISPNHMDWHENMEDYVHAKGNLIAHQTENDWCILNANDENSAKMAEKGQSQVFWVGKKEGGNWVMWENENAHPNEGEETFPRLQARNNGKEFTLVQKSDLRVKTHPDNPAFAAAAALIHGVKPELIKKTLSEFKGMPQRIEFVREIDSIKFYNDSACTTPESALVCLEQFQPEKLILMLGGSSKNADFSFLAHHLVEKGVRVYLFGEEGKRIQQAIQAEGGQALILKYDASKDFAEVIRRAYQCANPEDNIVLSPACASFDMFKHSKERGKLFNEIVLSL